MSVVQTAFHLPAVTPLKGTLREMRDRAQTHWRTWRRESLLRHNAVWLRLRRSPGDIMSCVMPAKLRS